MRRALLLFLIFTAAVAKKRETSQVLELPKDPPPAVAAETRNLVFHVAPLSAKGLLSQQVREGLKALLRVNSGATIVKVRAFVAGSGDMRRVPALVSEVMSDKHLALPAVSVVQVGGLPLEGAQVVLESVAEARKPVDPGGLLFTGGQEASVPTPLEPVEGLTGRALARLDEVLNGASALRVTCFTSSTGDAAPLQSRLGQKYPQAAVNVVVAQRASSRTSVNCDATARLPESNFKVNGNEASAVLSRRVAFTGTQVAFGFEDNDARLAFERIGKALDPLGASTKTVAQVNVYPLSRSIAEQVKRIRLEFFDPNFVPPSTILPFEGLPALDASFAVDVTAAVTR